MKPRECIEVHIRPQLSFKVPEGMDDEVLAYTRFVREDGMVEATLTILEDASNALGTEMGRLAEQLDSIGYDVKFLREE